MTELGGSLQGTEKVERSIEITRRFAELRALIGAEMARGMAPESVKRYSQVREALVTAERVVLLAVPSPDGQATHMISSFQ